MKNSIFYKTYTDEDYRNEQEEVQPREGGAASGNFVMQDEVTTGKSMNQWDKYAGKKHL